MSPTLTKILVAIGVVITFGAIAFIIYNQQQIKNQQTAIQTQMVAQQQLVDGIMRSQSQYATAADLAKFASDNNINLKAIQDNLSELNAQLASINVITANSTGQNVSNLPSTGTGPANPNLPPVVTVPCTPGGTVTCPNSLFKSGAPILGTVGMIDFPVKGRLSK
jgi:type II secretory pathway pseudopilin PulG